MGRGQPSAPQAGRNGQAPREAEAVAISYRAGRPMVFVERQSPHYPYTSLGGRRHTPLSLGRGVWPLMT